MVTSIPTSGANALGLISGHAKSDTKMTTPRQLFVCDSWSAVYASGGHVAGHDVVGM